MPDRNPTLLDKAWRYHLGSSYASVGRTVDRCHVPHHTAASSTWTVLSAREEDIVACSVLGQLVWLASILECRQLPVCQPHQQPETLHNSTSILLAVERDTPCTSILGGGERDAQCTSKVHDCGGGINNTTEQKGGQ